jgi:hypothetical protein
LKKFKSNWIIGGLKIRKKLIEYANKGLAYQFYSRFF